MAHLFQIENAKICIHLLFYVACKYVAYTFQKKSKPFKTDDVYYLLEKSKHFVPLCLWEVGYCPLGISHNVKIPTLDELMIQKEFGHKMLTFNAKKTQKLT